MAFPACPELDCASQDVRFDDRAVEVSPGSVVIFRLFECRACRRWFLTDETVFARDTEIRSLRGGKFDSLPDARAKLATVYRNAHVHERILRGVDFIGRSGPALVRWTDASSLTFEGFDSGELRERVRDFLDFVERRGARHG